MNEQTILRDYAKGIRIDKITDKHGLCKKTLYNLLHRTGIPLRGPRESYRYDHGAVVADYLGGMPVAEIAEQHGMPFQQSVYHVLHKHDVPLERPGGPRPLSMKPWNHTYFDGNSPEVAYWAGFLMADGSLVQDSSRANSWSLALSLHVKDRCHVLAFCGAIGLDRNFVTELRGNKTTMARAVVYHPDLPQSLRRWGIIPRKSWNFLAPDVPHHLLPHYLRGWADGDGYIACREKPRWVMRFSITGNPEAVVWYKDALYRLGFKGNAYIRPVKERKCARMLIHARASVLEMPKLLKVRGNLHLARKWAEVLSASGLS